MTTLADNNENDFLADFSNYTSVHDQNGDADDQWKGKCYGRKPIGMVRKTFKDRFSEGFINTVTGENGNHSFDNFKISSSDVLNQVDERFICTKCNKSRRFYCYSCFVLSPQLETRLPTISLPVRIDIVKHAQEVDGKTTATHAVVLAPNEVRIFTYPNLPDDWPEDPNKILLVFPRKGTTLTISQYLNEYFSSLLHPDAEKGNHLVKDDSKEVGDESAAAVDSGGKSKRTPPPWPSHLFAFPFERVVFIDSTWRQSKSIAKDPRIQCLPAVVIDSEKTRFWRSNMDRPAHFLSTIEAIYYFCRQLHNFMADLVSKHRERIMAEDEQLLLLRQFPPYDGQFDNLLFFFKHTYQVIKKRYKL
ncbi:DTW domain-containing protein 1 [Tyrophagus putrescentiae]|nr:DTW domain-containing protein 1 [Tyrophagus putrescentiae]